VDEAVIFSFLSTLGSAHSSWAVISPLLQEADDVGHRHRLSASLP